MKLILTILLFLSFSAIAQEPEAGTPIGSPTGATIMKGRWYNTTQFIGPYRDSLNKPLRSGAFQTLTYNNKPYHWDGLGWRRMALYSEIATIDISGKLNITDTPAMLFPYVRKITGKGLSTEDYTTAEKSKLSGIATGATANSTDAFLLSRANHTGAQAATTITEDATHRFATDAEKTTWNAKQDALGFTPVPNTRTVNGHALSSNVTVTKSDVGLANADNTSDLNKPVSTATQTALDLKANLASPTFTGTVSGITKTMVGLGNVDNTTDLNKPISTATQAALDLKVAYVDDLTSLIAYSGASTTVIVRDSSTGGTFNYKTSGYTVDGGVVIAATGKGGGTKSWLRVAGKRVNPKWWGALGDGVNDDGPFIQKAVDYCTSIGGGTVVFPRGTFRDTIPVYWASKVNIDGEGDQSIIYNNRTEDDNTPGVKYLPLYFGNYQPQSYDSTNSRYFNSSTISGNRITLSTNSDLDSFTRGQIIIVRSASGWYSKDDVTRPFKPYVVRINRVDSILSPNIIVMEDPIDTVLSGGKVAINGHFISGAPKALDENHHATYYMSDIDVRNVAIKSKGEWSLRMSVYKANWQNLLLYGAEGVGGNGMAYHTWNNIRSFYWKQFSESSIGTHNTTIENVQATWVNNSFLADASKPVIRFGENVHKVTIRNINIDAGASPQRGIRANDATNCTVDGLTLTGRNLSTYGVRLENGDDTDLVSNIIIKNSTFILGSTNRYVDMDKGGFTNSVLSDNIIENNRFLGAVSTSVKLDGTNQLVKNNYFQSGDMAVNTLPVNGYVVGNYMATPTQTLTNITFRNNYSGSVYPSSTTGTLTNLTATNGTGQTWTITNPTSAPNIALALTNAGITATTNKNYVTDAQLTVIGNTSGTNTGDQDLSGKLNISDTAAMQANDLRSGSIAWPGTIYTTPTDGTVSSHKITYSPSLATQTANTVLAGPGTGSAAAPTFRSLVAADIPSLPTYAPIASPTFTGTVTLPSGTTLTTPVINGLATGTGVTSNATASTIVTRDANGNININSANQGYTTTATAAGTTTLTAASTALQFFTGSTTQTVIMPVVSTLTLGQQYYFRNNSTGQVSVLSSDASGVVGSIAAGTSAVITCILTSGVGSSSWDTRYIAIIASGGKSLTALNRLSLSGTDGTTMTFPSTSATIARTDAANTFTGDQAMSSLTLSGVNTTATTGTGSMVLSASPTFTGTPVLPTPFTVGGVSMTSTGTQLNYLNTASGVTGTGNVVLSSQPALTGSTTINGSLTVNTTSLIFRTTNGGSNITSVGIVDIGNSNSTAGSLGVAWDNTTGFQTFTAANGSRRIARAYTGIAGLVNTAGSESADMVWGTQAAGALMAEHMRMFSTGDVSIGSTTDNAMLYVNGSTRFDLGSDANYDLHYRGSTGLQTRLANGTTGQVLTATTSGAPSWATPGTGITTVGAFNTTATAAGLDITGVNIALHAASSANPGAVSTGTQTMAGNKTWNGTTSFANDVTITSANFSHTGGSMKLNYLAKTANYTVTVNDYMIDCTSNTFTLTLPTAVGVTGRVYILKNSGTATTITIATTSSQTIDGAAPGTITTMTPLRVISDGANWKTW